MPSEQHCAHVKDDGERCRTFWGINPRTGMCFHHDPERRRKAQRARRNGGHATAEKRRRASPIDPNDVPPEPRTVDAAADMAAWAARAMLMGEISRHEARDLGSVLRTVLEALKASDLAARMEELQAEVAVLKSRHDMKASS